MMMTVLKNAHIACLLLPGLAPASLVTNRKGVSQISLMIFHMDIWIQGARPGLIFIAPQMLGTDLLAQYTTDPPLV